MLQNEKDAIIQQLRSISTPETEKAIGEAIITIHTISEENKALLHSYEDCAARLQQVSLENLNEKFNKKTIYILVHYIIRNKLIFDFAGIIGVYSTEGKAKEAIPSRYNEEIHKYEVHPMVVDQVSPHTYL